MPDESIEQKILQDLTLEALRATYRERRSYESVNGWQRIFLRSYGAGFVPSDEARMQNQQRALSRNPSLVMRAIELRADGIYLFVEVEREYNLLDLSAFVDLSPRGVRLLEGKGIGFSTIIRSVRRTLIACWWVLAVLLIPIYLWERIGKQGLMFTVAGLAVLLIFQFFWMRLFRRDA
jgi:hypothetical protein